MQHIKVAEMFAGVGGFRLALDGYQDPAHPELACDPSGPYRTIWANQWEPPGTTARQFAARCYNARWSDGTLINEDITAVLDAFEAGTMEIPDVDMVVGGFPCQDYSVARPLHQSNGIEGKKGVLWWQIYRFLRLKRPKYALFENVDRLLKSPASQRGRDFAIMLACFAELGYSVEWRIVNSADYGAPQRRKRVYIFAERSGEAWNLPNRLVEDGVLSESFPAYYDITGAAKLSLDPNAYNLSTAFGKDHARSPFKSAGVMQAYRVLTTEYQAEYSGTAGALGDVLLPDSDIPANYFIDASQYDRWAYLKGAKRERRVNKRTGEEYFYSEGAMAFPDRLDKPSRTILTGDGGASPSRTKHVVQCSDGRYRRLTPDELDRLQCFPQGWTDTGMTDLQRAFCMGNALVVDIIHRIGVALAARIASATEYANTAESSSVSNKAA